jgi:hypothetical protein
MRGANDVRMMLATKAKGALEFIRSLLPFQNLEISPE